jgi:hypothetical protein
VSGLSLLAVPLLAVALPADYREEGAVLIPWIAVGSMRPAWARPVAAAPSCS